MSEKAKGHTPGPWHVRTAMLNPPYHHIESADGWRVATCFTSGDDANLLAAAPELLEALEALLEAEVYADGEGICSIKDTNMDGSVDAVNKARAALAKARGEA